MPSKARPITAVFSPTMHVDRAGVDDDVEEAHVRARAASVAAVAATSGQHQRRRRDQRQAHCTQRRAKRQHRSDTGRVDVHRFAPRTMVRVTEMISSRATAQSSRVSTPAYCPEVPDKVQRIGVAGEHGHAAARSTTTFVVPGDVEVDGVRVFDELDVARCRVARQREACGAKLTSTSTGPTFGATLAKRTRALPVGAWQVLVGEHDSRLRARRARHDDRRVRGRGERRLRACDRRARRRHRFDRHRMRARSTALRSRTRPGTEHWRAPRSRRPAR